MSVIRGSITDNLTAEPLAGATILLNDTTGTTSRSNGEFMLSVKPGIYTITCHFVGYHLFSSEINISPYDTVFLNIKLEVNVNVLEEIVVTAGKFNQKLSDVTVSMDIIKPVMIEQNNDISMEMVINRLPGIDVLDGQTSIRGGSGYSYGAGSRVMVLIDDLPILSADVADVKWDYMPVENIAQVEILKGASSVLYGSSALNGVINIRTAFPKPDPESRINIYSGIYLDPKRKEMVWWNKQPVFYGANLLHSRKYKNLDIVGGGNLFHNPGYRENEYDTWGRGNLKFNVTSNLVNGLNYGVNVSSMYQDKSDFLLWVNAGSGAYRQNPDAVSALTGFRMNIDPYITFRQNEKINHTLKARILHIDNVFKEERDKDNKSTSYYAEYRLQREFGNDYHWSVGTSADYSSIISNLYGDHNGMNLAFFTQMDMRFLERLKWSAGIRWETATLDHQRINSLPVFRTGLNLQIAEYTYLRSSIGQGYRFPSIAEKFTATTISSLNIFPNPELKSEKGWSAEIGIKQGIPIGNWQGFADISAFWTEYDDMIEFTFGVYKPDSVQIPTLEHIGFKPLNIGNARINGIETSFSIENRIGDFSVLFSGGYTYMNPVDLNIKTADTASSSDEWVLKYRYRNSLKGDLKLTFRNLTAGFNMIYRSNMVNVDPVFTDPIIGNLILPGYGDYREKHDHGYLLMDSRISYDFSKNIKLALIIKNMLNKEYIGRPGDIGPPRNITMQLTANF